MPQCRSKNLFNFSGQFFWQIMADVKATPTPSTTSTTSEDKPKNRNHRKGNDHQDNRPRKKPELEHYKPGAFGSKSKPEDEQHNEANEDQQSKPKNQRKRNNNQNQQQEQAVNPNAEQGSEKRNNRGNRKKPDQAHYVPKKSNNEGKVFFTILFR